MTDSEQHRAGAGHRPIGALLAQIADPGQHVGGGTAAAVAAALAGASAALVANLSAGRKSNREHADQIRADIDRLDELQSELLVAARDDEAALSTLLDLYKVRDTPESEMIAALERAAQTSITIARAAAEVCDIAWRQAPIASRFTISDLGAAAVIAQGAAVAAVLTAETNAVLLRKYESVDPGALKSLVDTINTLEKRATDAAQSTLELTRKRIAE